MKKLFLSVMLLAPVMLVHAQKAPYNVVFDVTSKDTIVHQMVAKWVNEIINADPKARVEVVYYGKSLDMVTKGKSVIPDDVMKLTADKRVSLKVCEIAMKKNNIMKDQLLAGVTTVPDGIYEIVQREHDGWAYIKADR